MKRKCYKCRVEFDCNPDTDCGGICIPEWTTDCACPDCQERNY